MSELEIYLITTIRQMVDLLDHPTSLRDVITNLRTLENQANEKYDEEYNKRLETKKLEGPGGLHR